MIQRPPRSTRTYTRFTHTTLFRSRTPPKRARAGPGARAPRRSSAAGATGRHRRESGPFRGREGYLAGGEPSTAPGSRQRRESAASALRSEEHTSELQSLKRISSAFFCLKKNKNTTDPPHTIK